MTATSAGTKVVKSNANGVVQTDEVPGQEPAPFGGNNIVCTDTTSAPNGCLVNMGELSADPNADQSSAPLKFGGLGSDRRPRSDVRGPRHTAWSGRW